MKRAIAWFVGNPVAANLLMAMLVIGGLVSAISLHLEEFPRIDRDVVSIKVDYLGAAPAEVEDGVCIRIEEAIEGIEGIRKITSEAFENQCVVNASLLNDTDDIVALNEIKSKVDAINTFPRETERPVISKQLWSDRVIALTLSGQADERTLKELGKEVRDELLTLPAISQVDLKYIRPYEISVEVSETTLRRHGLTITQVAEVIRNASLDLPGGTIRTDGGEILIRTKAQAYRAADFEDIVVLTRTDGTRVLLREIANIVDGFEDTATQARFNGKPAIMVEINRVGNEDLSKVAKAVKTYAATKQEQFPPNISLTIWQDSSIEMQARLAALGDTGLGGFALVLVTLTLFLRFRLALWVALGIPIAMLGTMTVLPYVGININTLMVLGLILVLGIVVDDAIVVGERVYAHEQKNEDAAMAAVEGTFEVSMPVIFGVLTTMVAFLPMLFATGLIGVILKQVGTVVVISLAFSLIESQFVLPAHLAHRSRTPVQGQLARQWLGLQSRFSDGLLRFAEQTYQPLLMRAIEWRYAVSASALAILIITFALVASDRIIFQFFPPLEGDRIYASLELPAGVDRETSLRAIGQLEQSAELLRRELDKNRPSGAPSMVKHILSSIGTAVRRGSGAPPPEQPGQSHYAEVVMELLPAAERNELTSKAVAMRWRELTGPVPEAVALTFSSDDINFGAAIDLELRGSNLDELRLAAVELRGRLAQYPGVFDLADSFRAGKEEIRLELSPQAENLGIKRSDLARQVRQAFYGEEVQRVQRGQDELKVMVRYPLDERRSISSLEKMRIRTKDGTEVPFASVARFHIERGYATIKRVDRQRVVNVTADVDRNVVSPEGVLAEITENVIPEVLARYPSVQYRLAGEQEEQIESMSGVLRVGLLAILLMFALLAIPLNSYAQPLLIMSVIPFGLIGAIAGHILLGWPLVFFSLLGMAALSGVVVNASLILLDYINRRRVEGMSLTDAVATAGTVRFRPIVLTAVTTFVGVSPLIFSKSVYTLFFIPMAISLAFGVLFATLVTLFLVPVLYVILEDFIHWRTERTVMYVPKDGFTHDVR